jgi:hypothetical protein
MKEGTRSVEVSITMLLALAGAALVVGIYRASDHHDAAFWWAAATACFFGAVLVAVGYFAIHPFFSGHHTKVQPRPERHTEALPSGERAHARLMQPTELRDYLRQIKKTMEEEGFGSTPQEPPREVEGDRLNGDVQVVRNELLRRGHDLLTSIALNLPSDAALSDASPATLTFVRDGQEFISQYLPQEARPELLFRYKSVREEQNAIEETLSAVRSIGHLARSDPEATKVDRGRIVRANVQSVLDELASARGTINEGLEDQGFWWRRALTWDTWDNVKGSLSGEPGFHAAYNATREAWDSLQRAELDRLNFDPTNDARRGEFASWERRHVQEALDKSERAEGLLFSYLANYDLPAPF